MKLVKEKIKNFTSLLLLFSILLGTFSPFQDALASWDPLGWLKEKIGAPVKEVMGDVAVGIASFVANLIIGVVGYLLNLVYGVLLWIISEDFLGVSMTGPDNPLVYNGWTYVRDLANIFLVLGLIIIGLGIILGIKEYEAKKTLPILIIIALLINFTPVICGWIIDFSNYLMQWLLRGGFSDGFVVAIQQGLNEAGGAGKEPLETIMSALIFIIFGLISVVVVFLYCLLFLMRYVFLWILIIFSPIAFASKVFGENKYLKMLFPGFLEWNNWWGQFIQWCIIGVFGAFFLFLANKLMVDWMIPAEKFSPEGATFLGSLFMYIFPLLLLLIGFFATLEAAQAGMAVLPGMSAMTKFAMAQAAKGAVKGAKKVSEAIPEKMRRGGERWARTLPPGALLGRGETGWKGWAKRHLASPVAQAITSPYWISKRGLGRAFSAGMESQMSDIGRAEKETVGMTHEQKYRKLKTSMFRGERIGTMDGIIRDHEIDDIRGLLPEKEKKEFDELAKATMGEAALVSRGSFMTLARACPQYTDEVVGKLTPEIREKMLLPDEETLKAGGFTDEKGNASYGAYITSGIKPEHVEYMDRESMFGSPEEGKLEKNEKEKEEIEEKLEKSTDENIKKKEGEVNENEKKTKSIDLDIATRTHAIESAEPREGETERVKIWKKDKEELIEKKGKLTGEKEKLTGELEQMKELAKQRDKFTQELSALTAEINKSKEALKKLWMPEELEKRSLGRKAVWNHIHKSWTGYHDEEGIKTFRRPFADKFMGTVKEEKGAFWYALNNPQLASYLTSIFAPESGFFMPERVTSAEVTEWREKLNKFSPEEMKKLQGALEKLPIEMRRMLTQFLKIDSERVDQLRRIETDQDIIKKLNEWKTSGEEKKKKEKGE